MKFFFISLINFTEITLHPYFGAVITEVTRNILTTELVLSPPPRYVFHINLIFIFVFVRFSAQIKAW
jgi:hypothetical protein